MAEVAVDAELCIASETCVGTLPEAFTLDDEIGVARTTPGIANVSERDLEYVVARCPAAALSLVSPQAQQP
jgi:ferredoxin